MTHPVQQKQPYSKRSIVRKELTLIVGRTRSFRPVSEGRVYFVAVQVTQRADTRTQLFDYLPGYASVAEALVPAPGSLDGPARRDLEFIPRIAISHDDLPDFIDVLSDAHERVADLLTKQANLLNRL